MKKTLIILGNGFDLDLGWKTSYSDFYEAKQTLFQTINRLSYVQKMIIEGHWYNLEGYLRDCMREITKEKVEDLNIFWYLCKEHISDYLSKNENMDIYTTNTESCAYRLLGKVA